MDAPGSPGIAARWTSSAKDGVGTALSARSQVWFTLSHGILNEIYYPSVDTACTRDLGLIVTDGQPGGFFAEEKRDTRTTLRRYSDGVPSFQLSNSCARFRIQKQVLADPLHDCVLQRIQLIPEDGADLRLFALLAPHLVNGGAHNTGWVEDYKGRKMLFASGDGTSLALCCSAPFLRRSVGFAGTSDGWQMLREHGALVAEYGMAADGNIALCGELDAQAPVLLALGFGRDPAAAAFQAVASLERGFERAQSEYAANWEAWQQGLQQLDMSQPAPGRTAHNLYRVSTTVLRCHESPLFPGGAIASLSIPWGASKGDDDIGGYHLVWPRDLVETAGALLACGALRDARRILDYLRVIQEERGDWLQNTWLDGTAYWSGTQMDETAFPILLLDLAFRQGAVPEPELAEYWPMARRAAAFIVRQGPSTGQDRWEENSGYTPATIAVEIAGLLAAADIAERLKEPAIAGFLRDTADAWNADLERWLYVSGTELARQCDVSGYYLRIVGEGNRDLAIAAGGEVLVKNRPAGQSQVAAEDLVGADVVALVRLGLRSPHDPRILNSLKVIDHLTQVALPQGPLWHRYNHDGYGEHADGSPFDGTGIGRAWPLLTGERAHCAIAAGDMAQARRLCATLEGSTSAGGMLPEQVWDADDIPALELFRGRPSGSAMPLVWAHAEYIKLLRSLADGAVFDLPPQTVRRYIEQATPPRCRDWREEWWRSEIPRGQNLRVQLPGPGTVRWTADGWASFEDVATADTGLGIDTAELPGAGLPAGGVLEFTWRLADGSWRGKNFSLRIAGSD